MRNYDNPYFGIEIEFPESWKCRYWGNRANPHQFSHHQAGYDDLPSEPGSFKELFSAHRAIKSHSIMGTMIAMAAFYKPADFDISDERDVFDCEIKREVGEFIVHGNWGNFYIGKVILVILSLIHRYIAGSISLKFGCLVGFKVIRPKIIKRHFLYLIICMCVKSEGVQHVSNYIIPPIKNPEQLSLFRVAIWPYQKAINVLSY